MDVERSSMLPQIASGVGSILFAISIDNAALDSNDTSQSEEIVAVEAPAAAVDVEKKRRRKVPRQVVLFDDEPSVSQLSFNEKIILPPQTPPSNLDKLKRRLSKQSDVMSVQEDEADGDEKAEEVSLGNLSLDDSESELSNVKLTPMKNSGIGALIPVSLTADDVQSSDSASIKSGDYATAATSETVTRASSVAPSSVDTSAISREELKQALLSIMARKDELQEQVQSLKSLLQKETDKSTSLGSELHEFKRKTQENQDKTQSRLQTLTRENDLLKHQLKKYVSAVMKLRDGPQAYETLAKLEGRNNKTVSKEGEHISYVDYHYEASEFEKKLIQVAEMHGELLEFNEHLQKTIKTKDVTIRRLKEELVDLRGPLPDEESEAPIPDDAKSLQEAARPLINIWVPSVFMSGNGNTTHHVYQVYLRIREQEWNIYRRYSEFYAFHKDLLKKDEELVKHFDFPPKKTVGYKTEKVVEDRRKRLQTYLRNIVNLMVQTNPSLAAKPDKEHVVLLMPFFGENSLRHETTRVTNNRPSLFRNQRNQIPQLAL